MASDLSDRLDGDVRVRAVIHALGIVVAAYAAAIVLTNVAGVAVILAGYEFDLESTPIYMLASVLQFLGFILAVAFYVRYREDFSLFEWGLPTLRQVGLVAGGFVLLYLLNVGAGAIAMAFEFETATNNVVERGQANPEIFLFMIPITVLLVAPGEELLFRGVVQGWFRRAFGVVPGILLASGIFGAIHYFALQGEGALLYVVVAAMLGVVLGALYEYSQNMVVPIAVHGLYNALLFGVQYLVASGYVTVPT